MKTNSLITILIITASLCLHITANSQAQELEGKLIIDDSLAQQIEINNAGTGGVRWRLASTQDGWNIGGGKFIINNSTNSNNSKFIITSDGNVGIGALSPLSKFEVNGKINVGDDGISPQEGDLKYNSTINDFSRIYPRWSWKNNDH